MEEHQARPGSPPVPVHSSRRPYSPEHKQAILRAFAVWKGTKGAFCQLQGIHQATLKAWERFKLVLRWRGPGIPKRAEPWRRG
jgi:transposase-like protein